MRTVFSCSAMTLALLAGLLLLTSNAPAQIPNAGFESWSAGNPVDWSTNNSPELALITQTNVAHSGASAAQGTVLSAAGFGISPALASGEGEQGFPINFRPAALHGFYTFTSVGGDNLMAVVALSKGDNAVGGATAVLPGVSSYTEFIMDIIYFTDDTPDTVDIAFVVLGQPIFPNAGSTFRIDDLSWGASSGVKEVAAEQPQEFRLEQNYPNPFNPSTTIRFSTPENGFVTLKVYDVIGREVSTLVEQQLAPGSYETNFSAGSLASGLYVYQLKAGGSVETRRMLLLR